MSLNKNNINQTQKQLEERVKYFIKNESKINKKQKNLKRMENYDNFETIIDPIYQKNKEVYAIFTSRNGNIKKNNNINEIKDKINESTLSTKTLNDITDVPIKKSISIQVSKELAKFAEPKFTKTEFLKIPQKFSFNENNNNIEIKINKKQRSRHRYTNSELELLETDEKVSQNEIEEITNNNVSSLSLSNIEDIYSNKNIIYIFHYLSNIDKCYQELFKDLKGNGLKNINYKLKVAYSYLTIIMEDKNLLSKIFLYNEDDVNVFLNRELCIFLSVLFLDSFINGLNDNYIKEFLTCLNYCHNNLLYVMFIVIQKIEEAIKENKIKLEENSLEYNDYNKCKIIIELNNEKLNINKYKDTFHTNNKIIKNIILNLLNILRDINGNIAQNIIEIFNLSKTSKFRTIIVNQSKLIF